MCGLWHQISKVHRLFTAILHSQNNIFGEKKSLRRVIYKPKCLILEDILILCESGEGCIWNHLRESREILTVWTIYVLITWTIIFCLSGTKEAALPIKEAIGHTLTVLLVDGSNSLSGNVLSLVQKGVKDRACTLWLERCGRKHSQVENRMDHLFIFLLCSLSLMWNNNEILYVFSCRFGMLGVPFRFGKLCPFYFPFCCWWWWLFYGLFPPETRSKYVAPAVLELTMRTRTISNSQRSTCLCPPGAEIIFLSGFYD